MIECLSFFFHNLLFFYWEYVLLFYWEYVLSRNKRKQTEVLSLFLNSVSLSTKGKKRDYIFFSLFFEEDTQWHWVSDNLTC